MNVLQDLITAVLQVLVFSLIPFIWWLITARKEMNFFHWIGLKKPRIENPRNFILALVLYFAGSLVLFWLLKVFLAELAGNESVAANRFAGMGLSGLAPALIYAFIQTGLAEEILFRGFLGKRLGNKFGFNAGNIIQALLFGLMHGVLFFAIVGPVKALIIILITGFVGWTLGYINEKQAGGSIVPSWLLHGLSNLISALAVMF